jgi:predicted dehydrogenase
MDIGCYNINSARLLFGGEPVSVRAAVRRDPVMGVDIVSSALLEFAGGGQATFTCSTRAEPDQRVHIVGDKGRIDIEVPFNIPPDRETKIFVTSDDGRAGTETRTVTFPAADQYTIQAELFAAAILDDTPLPVPIDDAIANMKVIEAILAC